MSQLRASKFARASRPALLLLLASLFEPRSALADYTVDAGDVLEISVFGVNELRQRGAVNVDGEFSLPLVGQIKVAGRTLPDIRSTIQQLLARKEFRHRAADGREEVALRPEQISVDIVEYRPVYVNGDVSRPGAQPYRPKMTVRAAVALAGGYDVMRFRVNDPFLEATDLRAEYQTLWTDFAKEKAQIWRFQSQLDGGHQGAPETPDAPIPPTTTKDISSSAAEQKKADDVNYKNELSFLIRVREEADKHLSLMMEQEARDKEAEKLEVGSMEKTKELFQKSIVPANRLLEQQRLSILAATRLLQTSTQVAQSRKEREDVNRRIGRLDDERRIGLLAKLQDSVIKLESIRNKIQAVGEKLIYTGAVRSQLIRGRGGKPDIAIFRKDEQGAPQTIVAEEDSELLPGDVVDIGLRATSVTGQLNR